jgi:hypothetical protein
MRRWTSVWSPGDLHCRSRSSRLAIFALVAAIPIGLLTFSGRAQGAFTPLGCYSSPWGNNIQINLGATRFDRMPGSSNYINNTSLGWTLFLNPNVTRILLHTPGFWVEPGYDYLQVNYNNGSTYTFTGNYPANTTYYFTSSGYTGGEKSIGFVWFADYSVVGQPPYFDTVTFECDTTQGAINNLSIGAQAMQEGFLIGQSDVIYVTVSQPANTPLLLSLEGLGAAASADFDLYASTTTSLPDAVNYTWKSAGYNTNEFLKIPSTTSARNVYIAVYAYATGGHFSLHVMNQGTVASKRLKVCTPGFSLDPNSTRYQVFKQTLQNTSLRVLAASRGNLWISGYDIYTTSACTNHPCESNQYTNFCSLCDHTCQICMDAPSDPDYCTIGQSCGSASRVANISCSQYSSGAMGNVQNGAFVWAHEWGHSQVGFGDEYYTGGGFCGHTLMNGPSNSNFWCSAFSHCKDGAVPPNGGEPACASAQDNWSRAPGSWTKPAAATSTEPDIELPNNWNDQAMATVDVILH